MRHREPSEQREEFFNCGSTLHLLLHIAWHLGAKSYQKRKKGVPRCGGQGGCSPASLKPFNALTYSLPKCILTRDWQS